MGVLCAATDMEKGAKVFAVDLAPARLERAKMLGATHLINNQKGDCVEQIMKISSGKMDAAKLISHPFSLANVEEAYVFFKEAAKTGSLKVIMSNDVTDESDNDAVAADDDQLGLDAQVEQITL